MNGYINVKSPPAGSNLPVAVGDGCEDDTAAIQAALDYLVRWGHLPTPSPAMECKTQDEVERDLWEPYYSGIYFPAGIYRICGALDVPFTAQIRLFGDGGRGGSFTSVAEPQPNVFTFGPAGTVILQDNDGTPILRFQNSDTHDVTIERIGFRWRNQQTAPPNWAWRPHHRDTLPAGYTDAGAVGILFTGGGNLPDAEYGYYHIRISQCQFERGWRGVAIDDTISNRPILVWDTQIDHCHFRPDEGRGRLVGQPP